jgi:hypothetical protein
MHAAVGLLKSDNGWHVRNKGDVLFDGLRPIGILAQQIDGELELLTAGQRLPGELLHLRLLRRVHITNHLQGPLVGIVVDGGAERLLHAASARLAAGALERLKIQEPEVAVPNELPDTRQPRHDLPEPIRHLSPKPRRLDIDDQILSHGDLTISAKRA